MQNLPMYKLTLNGVSSIKDFTDAIGQLFVTNHIWKIRDARMAQFMDEAVINGREFHDMLESGEKFTDASFSALEGSQILFRISVSDECTIYTTRKHWVTFFEEKFNVTEKEEMDPDLPEFDEFMQD